MFDRYSLNDVQRWFQAVITHPEGVAAGVVSTEASGILEVAPNDVERVILPSRQMTALERLQIYGRAYFGRLIECLKAQFPAVHFVVGDQVFHSFANGYLIQHPSTEYTLNSLGRSFDTYLAEIRPPHSDSSDCNQPDFADFLIELARLERTYNEVFDGPGPERTLTLQSLDFEGMSPENFANCRLIVQGCVRLLELQFPVHEYASAVRRRADAVPPAARRVFLVITRRDYVVRHYEITRLQFELLSALNHRSTIGESLRIFEAGPDADLKVLKRELHAWFREWAAAPLFASLVRPTTDQ